MSADLQGISPYTVRHERQADTMAESTKQAAKKSTPAGGSTSALASRPKRPTTPLNWNDARRTQLVLAMRGGMTRISDLVRHLSDHESFDGDPAKVTDVKVRAEIKRLRKAGVRLPETSGRGGQPVDVERLNALLEGGIGQYSRTTADPVDAAPALPIGEESDD